MRHRQFSIIMCSVAAGALLLSGPATPQVKQVVTGPVAQYWVSASTNSGFSFGGGKPSMADMMGMMGGGSNVQHSLRLELGSNQPFSGTEGKADHTPPAGLGTGPLSLYWKAPVPGKPVPDGPPAEKEYEPPKGKIMLFWGCGEKAGPGQPVVIDLSKIMDPKERAGMMAKLSNMVAVTTTEKNLYPSRFKTFGEWPNGKDKKSIKGDSSLIGAHTVAGNYAPTINFNLSPTQDFLAAFEVTQNAPLPSGAVGLGWKPITQAKAYFASSIGGKGDDGEGATVVFWNSANVQTGMMMAMMNYLPPADIERLLGQKILLSPQTTTCAVPAEVIKAAPQSLYTLSAFGPEANFSYPPRPSDPKIAWNIEWTAKVRYRSGTGGLLGQDMGGGESKSGEPKKKKGGIMGDLIKGGLGL
jgi:hypothetical protein